MTSPLFLYLSFHNGFVRVVAMETDIQPASQAAPSGRARKLLFIGSAVFGVVILGFVVVCAYLTQQIDARHAKGPHVMFVVEKGERAQSIAKQLEARGLVLHAYLFSFHVWREDLSSSLQAGTYALDSGMSVREIAAAMARGEVWRDEVAVTIPEGFTLAEIQFRFSEVAPISMTKKAEDFKTAYDFLADAPGGASLEGYLFPDTYRFERGSISADAVAQKMLDNFGKKLIADMRQEIRAQGKTVFEIVMMASIIEKEVITDVDMKLASGLLWKRLSAGMPLQVDASVAYAVGHKGLTYDDLKVDSPYNTYRYKGLPKGPIANPGLRAINAALHPTASEYWFYLSKPDGQTVFSRTLQEHNRAKAKYL